MKPRNLLTIDNLIPGVHYIQYVDKAKENNHNYAERIVGYVKNGREKQAILLLGEYRKIQGIPQFIFDNHTVYQESINGNTGNYQSLADFVADLNRSGEIQEHALRNTMARAITTKLGNKDVSLLILNYLEHAPETKYPTGNKKYVPIFKKEIEKLNKKKAEEEEEEESGIIDVKLLNSLKNKPNNYDSRESNILYNLRTIFNNWTISKSSSKVHIESNSPPRSPPRSNSPPHSPRFKKGKSGGKRKTRNHKKTKKTRKTKRHR